MPSRPKTLQIIKPENLVPKWPAQKTPSRPDYSPRVVSSKKLSAKSEDLKSSACFHCKQKGHRLFECPKQINLMEGAHDEQETHHPKGEESEEAEEIEAKKDGEVLLVQQESTPTRERRWLQKNIFCSTGTIHGQHCTAVIDGGSFENITSQTLVDRLKLKVYKHNCPLLSQVTNDK